MRRHGHDLFNTYSAVYRLCSISVQIIDIHTIHAHGRVRGLYLWAGASVVAGEWFILTPTLTLTTFLTLILTLNPSLVLGGECCSASAALLMHLKVKLQAFTIFCVPTS